MDNELNLDDLNEVEASADKTLQVRNRFQQLANEKNQARQEKEAAEAKAKEAEAKLAQFEKESKFYKSFNEVSSKYPEATAFQDKIKEKVDQGYDLEDAAVAVLNREGKLTQAPAPQRTPNAEGGSALNNISEGEKSFDDMSAREKLSQLQEMEKSGELTQMLRQGINRS